MTERLSMFATQPPSFNEPTLDRHFVQQIGESFGSGGAVTPARASMTAAWARLWPMVVSPAAVSRKWTVRGSGPPTSSRSMPRC